LKTIDKTASTRKTTNKIFAIPTKDPAIPPNPKMAAINAMIKQVIANCNMIHLLLCTKPRRCEKQTTISKGATKKIKGRKLERSNVGEIMGNFAVVWILAGQARRTIEGILKAAWWEPRGTDLSRLRDSPVAYKDLSEFLDSRDH
jgi:hypothetical protein